MKRSSILVLLLSCAFAALSCTSSRGLYVIRGFAQGGTWEAKVRLDPERVRPGLTPEDVKEGIDSILLAVDNSVSGYNPASLLSRINAGEQVLTDSIFNGILERSIYWYDRTGGALDVAAGPLFNIWGFGFTEESMPSDSLVEATRLSCGMARALAGGKTVYNFNAVAQGYSCDLVAEYLHGLGVGDFMVNIGGEIFCDGVNFAGEPWSVGVDRPSDDNRAGEGGIQESFRTGGGPCGIVTSGNYRKFYIRDGKKYSHTVDPRTGRPVTHNLLSATVVAPNATDADALATACMVLGAEKALELVASLDGVEACLICDEGGVMVSRTSSGLTLE